MPATDAQKRAMAKYRQKSVKQLNVKFYPADHELLEWVKQQGGAPWVRELLRGEMEKSQRSQEPLE